MGKMKELLMDWDDDIHALATDMAADMLYMIEDKKQDMFDEMSEIVEDEDRAAFIQYLGGTDEDDFKTYIHNVIEQALADEGISV